MSLRLTTTKAKLQEMGEETEYACETLSEYRDLVLGLTANTSAPVDILTAEGQYKNTTQIIRELSKVWDELDSLQKASLTKSLVGVRQANIFDSLVENFDMAESAIKTAQSASEGIGSAMEEQNRWMESLEAKINRVTSAMQVLSTDIFDTDSVKAVVTAMGDLIIKFDDLIKKIDISKILMGAFVAWAFKVKNVFTASFTEAGMQVSIFGKNITLFKNNLQSANTQMSIMTSTAQEVTTTMATYNATLGQTGSLQTQLATTIPTTSLQQYLVSLNGAEANLQGYCVWLAQSAMAQEDVNLVVERYNSLHALGANAQAVFRAEIAKTNPIMAQYLGNTMGATASVKGYTAAQRTASVATKALTIATGILKTAMFSLVTLAVSALFQMISNAIKKHDELIEKVTETASAFDEEKKHLSDLKQQYTDLVNSTESVAVKDEKLKEIKKQLVEQYGLEADSIAKINKLREDGIEIFDELTKRELAQASADMSQGFENAVNDLNNKSGLKFDDRYGILGSKLVNTENIRKDIQSLFDSSVYMGDNNDFVQLGFKENDPLSAYNKLKDILSSMNEIQLTTGKFTEEEQEVYDELSNRYKKLTKDYQNAIDAAKAAAPLNAQIIYNSFIETKKAFEEVYNSDEYEEWYADLIATTKNRVGDEYLPYLEWAFDQMFESFKANIGYMAGEVDNLEDPFAKIKALILSAKQALSELDGEVDKSADKLDDLVKIINDNKDSDKFSQQKKSLHFLINILI